MPRSRAVTSMGIVLAVLAALACGCGEARDPHAELIERLAREPGLAPPQIAAEAPIVLLEVEADGTAVAVKGEPIPQPGATLRLERALASRRTGPPAHWVVVTSPDGATVRYWCATDPRAKVRFSIADPAGGPRHGIHGARGGAVSSVRVPFEPAGRIRFYGGSGGPVAVWRFGDTAGEALAREGP